MICFRLSTWCVFSLVSACRTTGAEPEAKPSTTALVVEGVLTDEKALAEAHDVELAGRLAIVAGKKGSFAVVDVADAGRPRLVGSLYDPEGLYDAETVLVDGKRAYLGTMDFLTVDLDDPTRPSITAKIVDRPKVSRINGMVRREHIVLAANKDGWIDAFDVSNPTAPRLFGALDVKTLHDLASPHDIEVYGDFAVVVDAQGFGRTGKNGKLALLRVPDATTHRTLPAAEWKPAGVVASPQLVGANRVKVSGDYAFVGGSTRAMGGQFVVVDPTIPNGLARSRRCRFPIRAVRTG
jgi:hypothetical protein